MPGDPRRAGEGPSVLSDSDSDHESDSWIHARTGRTKDRLAWRIFARCENSVEDAGPGKIEFVLEPSGADSSRIPFQGSLTDDG